MNKKIVIPIIALAIACLITLTVTQANAQGFKGNETDMISSLAKKLGIGEDKVKNAFDSIQSERQAQMQKQFEDNLSQAVKDAKITEAQKKLIIAKHQELQKNRETNKTNRQNQRQTLEDWATKNGIDLQYLFGGFGGMKGMKGGWMK